MAKNAIVGQSGGPTSVINSSLAGVYESCKRRGAGKVYGMMHGVAGLLERRVCVLDDKLKSAMDIELLKRTPSSYLGSCRYKLPDWHTAEGEAVYQKLFEILGELDIGYFFYIGGNDSMDTIGKLADYGAHIGSDIRFMGVPKTIDNDLMVTDHTPGYGSAAKYIGVVMKEIIRDATVYGTKYVTIVEIMGRNAGWLTASAALASYKGNGPDLIYLPEVDFDLDAFMAKVQDIYNKNGKCIVAVSEGIKDKNGKYISEYGADLANSKDSFGHAQLGGLASFLANEIKKKTGAKVRGIELSLLQRCAAHCASKTDIEESFAAGKAAVEYAVAGTTDKMVGFERTTENGKYKCNIKLFDLTVVANTEKKVPLEWLNETKDGLNEKFIEYALPLIQGETDLCKEDGLPRFVRLKKVKA